MELQDSIVIKLVSRKFGARMYNVQPDSIIASLWKIEGVNNHFFYHGTKLVENLTFKYYSINSGDSILAIELQRENSAAGMNLEKLRLDELYLTRLLNSPRSNFKLGVYLEKYMQLLKKPISYTHQHELMIPKKSDHPNNTPLPMAW